MYNEIPFLGSFRTAGRFCEDAMDEISAVLNEEALLVDLKCNT